jgi:predicted SAM-dependent methyltransferase
MVKLNVGSNTVRLSDWINLDILDMPDTIQHDARKRFPFDDNSVDFIFSEHFIEHLTGPEALFYFSECYRILKDGGVVRTSTFNIDTLFENLKSDEKWNEYKEILYDGMFRDQTRIQFFNFAVYEGGVHKYMFNPDEMIRLLKDAGFSLCNVCKNKCSSHEELKNLEWRENSDCIVEAIK